jgi:hypothetical protein
MNNLASSGPLPAPSVSLTEDEVKKLFIPFLKTFYRDRYEPDPGSIQTSLDNVGEGGLVADGMITFRKKDGTPFTCTYEATSRDKSGEVKYELNLTYFLWDCAAFAMVCTTVFYLYFYVSKLPWLVSLHAPGNLGLLTGLGLIGFFTWYFIMPNWRKYRYIYAIQQFKRYGADEQWIALADDVFPSANDPYLLELKSQCIYNGFGLALVSAYDGVRSLMAPSRLGIYGKDRRMIHWVTRTQWYQTVAAGVGTAARMRPGPLVVLWNKIIRPVAFLVVDPFRKYIWSAISKPFGQTAGAYSRFMEGQEIQKLIFFSALGLTTFLAYKVMQIKTENMADMAAIARPHAGPNPEDQPGYVVDGTPIPYNGVAPGVPKQYPTPVEQEDANTINLSGDDDKPTAAPAKSARKDKTAKAKSTPSGKDACARLHSKKGWILQESVYSSASYATDRVKALRKLGISCTSGPLSCLETGKTGYVVWIGPVQTDVGNARIKAGNYEKQLQTAGLFKNSLLVRKLNAN